MVNPPSVNHSPEYAGEDDEINLLDILGVIAENLRLLIIGPIVAGLISLVYANMLTPIFTAKTTIIPPGQSTLGSNPTALLGQLGGLGAFVGGSGVVKTNSDQYVAYLESNTLSDQLIEQFKLMERYKVRSHEQARQVLKGASKIVIEKKSGLIAIEVSDSDPKFAADLANAYVAALSKMLGKMAIEDAKFRRKLLEQQINEATEKSYRSPFVREAIIQSVVREYETAILDQKKDSPYIQQIDLAEVPEFKSGPKRIKIVTIGALGTGFGLLILVFILYGFRKAEEDPDNKIRIKNILVALRRQLPW